MIQLLKEYKKLLRGISHSNDSIQLQIYENNRKTRNFMLTHHSANISPNITQLILRNTPIFETKIEMQIIYLHILLKYKKIQIIKTVSEAVVTVIYSSIIKKVRFKELAVIIGSDLVSHLYHK